MRSSRRLWPSSTAGAVDLNRTLRVRHNGIMIKIIWLLATVYFMSRLVTRLVSSMQEIKREEQFDAGDVVVDVEAE